MSAKKSTALLEQGVPETIEVLGELIASNLRLKPGIVQIYNGRQRLPNARGYFVDVALLGSRPFAVRNQFADDPATLDGVSDQSVNVQEIIQVDIFSADDSARLHKFDVLFALTSSKAQQLATRWAFKIGRVPPSFVDASEVEGSTRLNRFAVTFNVLRAYGRVTAAPTFANFQNPPKTILTEP